MIFNMSEEEWDVVIETHLKGTFTVMRAATAVMKQQGFGSLIGFTSGAFSGSVAQANYSAAKGGIVSLMRSIAGGMHRYDVRSNIIAPVAKTRMSSAVPGALEMGEPEDVAPMVVYLLSDAAKDVSGQIYTCNGSQDRRVEPAGRGARDALGRRRALEGRGHRGALRRGRHREARPDRGRDPHARAAAKAKAAGKTENA